MNKLGKILVGTTAIVLAVALVVILVTKPKPITGPVFEAPQTSNVSITKNGFEPATVKVKKGSRVIWTNNDKEPHKIASNPFPENTDLPGLNAQANLGPNGTYSYQFDDQGTFDYHDDLNPKLGGRVIVE